jgi:hypothetical protein
MLIAILAQQLRPLHIAKGTHHTLDFESRSKLLNAPIPDDAKEAIIKPFPARISEDVGPALPPAPELGEDSRLQVFDEL